MEIQELFYPEIQAVVGNYIFQKGIEIEIYSDRASYFDWAKVRFTPEFQQSVTLVKGSKGELLLGYDGRCESVFQGYVTEPYSSGGYMDEVVLKDSMTKLEDTMISNTFLDAMPQEIIQFCLAQAGIGSYQLGNEIYQPKKVIPIFQKNAISVLKEVGNIWGVRNRFFFSGETFYWGTTPPQRRVYCFEYGVNIIGLSRPLGTWEIETVSMPFIRHSDKIQVIHPKISGEFEVQKVIFRTNETGFIRTYISF